MRIMVTGVTGQVGGALFKVLGPKAPGSEALAAVDSVVAASRDRLDLAQPDRFAAALDRIAPDLIINPAAYTAVDRAEDEKDIAFRVNAEAPAAIARWAAAREVPLIHFSTDYVFGGTGSRPWRENDPTNPLSVYGASKLAGEEAVRAAGGPHLIIRTSWVYAPNGANFLRTIARLAKERRELRIVADQFGAPTSARLIADTVASLVLPGPGTLAERFAASAGLINVAASGETSWYGFAVAIAEGLKVRGVTLAVEGIVPIATADYPTKAKRPANSRFDLTRLREVFGIATPEWNAALAVELDQLALELTAGAVQ
jgi:dTDP-4-dehydrorhamnose reductase